MSIARIVGIALVAGVLTGAVVGGVLCAEDTDAKRRPNVDRTVIKRFTPDRNACCARLEFIQEREQDRWGGPDLTALLSCESTMGRRVHNGNYQGVAMFGSSEWADAWRSIKREGARRVQFTTYEKRDEDRVKVVHRGWLPRHAGRHHDWAAVRGVTRAKSGDGPDFTWSCP